MPLEVMRMKITLKTSILDSVLRKKQHNFHLGMVNSGFEETWIFRTKIVETRMDIVHDTSIVSCFGQVGETFSTNFDYYKTFLYH